MRNYLVAAAVLFATAIPVTAGDYKGSGPSPWSGAYIGLHAGGAWSAVDWTYTIDGNRADHHGNGAFGGGQIGYNFHTGGLVFGVEADLSGSNLSGRTHCPEPTWSCQSEIDWLGSARLRAGFTSGPVLIYATGGFGFGGVEVRTVDATLGPFSTERTRIGWTAGGGVEWLVDQNWSIKGEYLYYDLGTDTYIVDFNLRVRADTTIHTGKIGFNYRF